MHRPMSRSRRRKLRFFHIYFLLLSLILALALTGLLAQTAFARTYVITDGDTVLTYTAFTTDPARVLDQAGLRLRENDTYTTEAAQGGATITICRAPDVTISYRGETLQAASQGETVGELLSRLGLEVTEDDILSADLEDAVSSGMTLRVDRVITTEETYTAAVPCDTVTVSDSTLTLGSQEVRQAGEDGEVLRTARVTYLNGEETHRSVLSETVTREPTARVVAVGSGEAAADTPVIGDGYILLPTGELLTYTRTDTVEATAYTHTDSGCDTVTATQTTVHRGTVAVDPRYIPYGTRMFIIANDGSYVYGLAVAEDCGGDIRGDRMDLYLPTYAECIAFGRRRCTIYFLS